MFRLAGADRLSQFAKCLLAALATPASATPGAGFDVLRYHLALTPDIAAKTLAGRETITLRATADGLRGLAFSNNALTIDGATLDGRPVRVLKDDKELVFELPAPLAQGKTARLTIAWHGRPARGVSGSASLFYTSYFACDWMVCAQDAVGDKARFALDLRVPAGMDALAVGDRIARRRMPDGSEVQSWRTSRPYSAYLFGFAIGRFARAGTARLDYLSDTATPDELSQRFADTPAMVRFLSAKAGLPLPTRRYSQLLVPGKDAQEPATYAILGTDTVPRAPGDPDADWAIVHELAHQWWGNLVTCATLTDFWLNEGITSFMTAAWKEHRHGRAAYDAELEVARTRLARAREKGFDKPLAWAGAYPSLAVRRAVQYSKGALFMDHLRRTLGERAFWAGLRRYTRAHAGGTVTSADLERAMSVASGRDLRPVFGDWVYGDERTTSPRRGEVETAQPSG